MMKQPRVLSMGAGVQTTACLIQYGHTYDAVIFADTGNEGQDTYQFVEKYLKPFCKEKGVKWITVSAQKDNKLYSVLDEALDHQAIERYFWQRQCTGRHKIRPVLNWIRKNIPCGKNNPCKVDIGFSFDESTRIGKDYTQQYVTKNYPLAHNRITHRQCLEIITKHGWPIPSKSSCTFCPFRGKKKMRAFAKNNPDTFKLLVDAENRDAPRTIFRGHKLENINSDQSLDDFESQCDSGHCFT